MPGLELFRSLDMQYVRLTIANDAAHDTMHQLGALGKFHLQDLNASSTQQSESFMYYKKRVVQCVQWERKFKRFEEEMEKNEVEAPLADVATVEYEFADVLTAIKGYVEPIESDLGRNLEYKVQETRKMNELFERSVVLEVCKGQLFKDEVDRSSDDLNKPFLQESKDHPMDEKRVDRDNEAALSKFHDYICGVIPVSQQSAFERMLFRISRGNSYVRFANIEDEIPDPATGEKMKKVVFYVVYVGQSMARKIEKMCDLLRATRYDIPNTSEQFDQEMQQISIQIQEKRQVLDRTQDEIISILNRVAWELPNKIVSPLRNWQEALRKEKAICDALKKCNTSNRTTTIAEGWVPVEDIDRLKVAVNEAVRYSGAQPVVVELLQPKKIQPPTYFKLNKITSTFQGIVDTYGVPRYQEVNPGLFTIVTFPFLFGVMYGDVGHGVALFCFALYLVLKEDDLTKMQKQKKLPEMLSMMFNGRYLLLFMATSGVYCGLVYNDFMSIPVDLFGTRWDCPHDIMNETKCVIKDSVYPFGMDPAWYNTKNELTFFNSLKMKLSVILGVSQMTFGIILSLFNHVYFHDSYAIWFEFIPQLVFMLSTFGYMVFMIFYKFCIDWRQPGAGNPPNLIQTMINMFLSPGSVKESDQLYPGQGGVQLVLVLLAVLSIPIMLFCKPILEHRQYLRSHPDVVRSNGLPRGASFAHDDDHDEKHEPHEEEVAHAAGGHGGHDEEEYSFSEHFIHQAIHTIEFILGAVSNTASYLRLWALSLAHAELALVFWEKLIMQYGVSSGSPIMAFVGFGAWTGATFAVLLCMDVLECFLHALRLHWVEFQSKFFRADGYAFQPFNFEVETDDS